MCWPPTPQSPNQLGALGPLMLGNQPFPQAAPGMDWAQQLRPLNPSGGQAEHTLNPNGTWSSERTATVQEPNGDVAVVPELWLALGGDGQRQPVWIQDDDTNGENAARYEAQTSTTFPHFNGPTAWDDAEAWSNRRESQWPTTPGQMGANDPLLTPVPRPRPGSTLPISMWPPQRR